MDALLSAYGSDSEQEAPQVLPQPSRGAGAAPGKRVVQFHVPIRTDALTKDEEEARLLDSAPFCLSVSLSRLARARSCDHASAQPPPLRLRARAGCPVCPRCCRSRCMRTSGAAPTAAGAPRCVRPPSRRSAFADAQRAAGPGWRRAQRGACCARGLPVRAAASRSAGLSGAVLSLLPPGRGARAAGRAGAPPEPDVQGAPRVLRHPG